MSMLPRHCTRCGSPIPGSGVHDCGVEDAKRKILQKLRGLNTVRFTDEELTVLVGHENEKIAEKAREALLRVTKVYRDELPALEKQLSTDRWGQPRPKITELFDLFLRRRTHAMGGSK